MGVNDPKEPVALIQSRVSSARETGLGMAAIWTSARSDRELAIVGKRGRTRIARRCRAQCTPSASGCHQRFGAAVRRLRAVPLRRAGAMPLGHRRSVRTPHSGSLSAACRPAV